MISVEEMKRLEDESEKKGVSKVQLMENAGKGIFKVLGERFELKNKKILVVCYHGNNGGDGFVAARHLCEVSDVTVLFAGDESKLRDGAKSNYRRVEKSPMIQLFFDSGEIDFGDFDVIIDALFGTGISGALKEPIASIVGQVNDSKAFKVAVDVPSGMNPDTGEAAESFVNADLIVTFHDIKKGLEGLKDKTVVVDVGIRGD